MTIQMMNIDRYRRMVAIIMVGKTNVNLAMIQAGAGECYRKYMDEGPEGRTFLAAEERARRERRGIWSQDDYISPSEFRRQNRIR